MRKFVVTITPPTPNGDLHIGHISGPFLAADVFTRTQRQRGHECVLVSYSDDYQSYMLRRGLELGTDPVLLASRNTDRIENSLAAVDIRVDNWQRTQDNPHFRQAVRDVFDAACAAGAVFKKTAPEPYCPNCRVWGYEAFGRGLCNFCGHDSDASQCEECAQAPDAAQMANFHCKLCGRPHVWVETERFFLDLKRFRGRLRAIHADQHLRAPLDSWIQPAIDTIGDWGVTRPGDAGLDLAADGSCRIHTWFMGLSGYIASFNEYAKKTGQSDLFDAYWKDEGTRLVHFLGFDCVFSHAIVYPVLLSLMGNLKLEQRFVPNHFLKLDGLNLSTSRGHAIWVAEFAAQASPDSIRLYLASIAPEQAESDFRRADFQAWRDELFGRFFPALIAAGPGTRPSRRQELDPAARAALDGFGERWREAADPDRFSMRAMAGVVLDAVELARSRMAEGRPVHDLAAFIAVAGRPLVPRLSDAICQAFALDADALAGALWRGGAA